MKTIEESMLAKTIKKATCLMAVLLLLGAAAVKPAEAWVFHCQLSPGGVSCYFAA
jgi:hypothetical protein